MNERQPQPIPRLWEQRSLEAWENLRCLGKQFTLEEQVEVINARLVELTSAQFEQTDETDDA